jgi:hypothetical protein
MNSERWIQEFPPRRQRPWLYHYAICRSRRQNQRATVMGNLIIGRDAPTLARHAV